MSSVAPSKRGPDLEMESSSLSVRPESSASGSSSVRTDPRERLLSLFFVAATSTCACSSRAGSPSSATSTMSIAPREAVASDADSSSDISKGSLPAGARGRERSIVSPATCVSLRLRMPDVFTMLGSRSESRSILAEAGVALRLGLSIASISGSPCSGRLPSLESSCVRGIASSPSSSAVCCSAAISLFCICRWACTTTATPIPTTTARAVSFHTVWYMGIPSR